MLRAAIMETKARIFGHPIHQMLIPIPIGLFVMATICDIIQMSSARPSLGFVAFCNLVAGICAALVAAVFGAIDWTGIPPDTRAKRVGAVHGIGNVLVVGLFLISVILRWNNIDRVASSAGFVLELIAFATLLVTGWLGGELVDRLGVGVGHDANVNAPSEREARGRTVVGERR
jgi:uncharacterized membrane protein